MCITVWQDRRKDGLLLAAGALAGATTCFLQPKGILLLVSIWLWLWMQRRREATSLSSLWAAVSYTHLTMPVEKLIQSMQPEQPMVVDSPSGGGGYGSSQSGSTSSTSAAPQ